MAIIKFLFFVFLASTASASTDFSGEISNLWADCDEILSEEANFSAAEEDLSSDDLDREIDELFSKPL